jgi:hypothetical protein
MSIYNGRRAPNLSQYIDNLNNGTSTAAAEPLGDLDDFSLANIDFFDFEMGDGLRAPVDFEQTLDTKPIGNTEPWEGQSSSDFLSSKLTLSVPRYTRRLVRPGMLFFDFPLSERTTSSRALHSPSQSPCIFFFYSLVLWTRSPALWPGLSRLRTTALSGSGLARCLHCWCHVSTLTPRLISS